MAIKQDVLSKYTYLKTPDFVVKNSKTYFSEGLTWSALSNDFSMRWFPAGAICADKGQGLFAPHSVALYCCGLLNSAVSALYLKIISPTLDFNCGYVRKVPYVYDANRAKKIVCLVQENIQLAKTNWDEFETSWDFLVHPLSLAAPTPDWNGGHLAPLDDCYAKWTALCEKRFNQMKANEEELNRLFIDIYNLHDELSPEVEDKDVTVRLADKKRDIKSLLSYAVGCMFGRYSLDEPGLIYAGGDWGDVFKRDALTDAHSNALTFGGVRIAVNSTWQINTPNGWVECTFCPEGDNIIPICDDDYFEDDITGKFIQFIETVFGKESLEENLCFIADALGGKGQPRDVIRNYFLNDFYTDHLKTYQKRPIYWLFDSGKKNGFKALIYMHRYQPDTIARMRTDYVHEQQARYRTAITDLEQRIAVASTSERVKLNRQLKKIQEQSTEIQGYEEKIHHLADQYIAIDLDDGVKKNYEIFKDVLAKIK